jgi:hypothetical protein
MRPLILFPVLLCILFSCRQHNKNADIKSSPKDTAIERTLLELTDRFPQLPKAKGKQSDLYRLERTVIIGTTGVELQLRSIPRNVDEPHKVIIVINSRQQMYGIPLFSNNHRDYWNFLFDTVLTSVQPVPTTFQRELQTCIDKLGLENRQSAGGSVVFEMFYATLGCRMLYDADSANLLDNWYSPGAGLPDEDPERCRWRFRHIWKAIYDDMHRGYIPCVNAFWDVENNRVYQFDLKALWGEKMNIKIKVYRTYCVCGPPYKG